MSFVWQNPTIGVGNIVLDIVLLTIIYALVFLIFLMVIKRKVGFVSISIMYFLSIVTYLFQLNTSFILVSCVSGALITVMMFANLGDLRHFIANPFKRAAVKTNKRQVEKIFDRHATYQIIESTVKALSKAKIGAIMTFEKSNSLLDFCKNGVPVDAPVSQELLMTIFYPGTRLHDGAVIIHGNTIVSASVFFTPSTKAFTGKYGSRHRAAIGISEVCDAVTVVVSEETGRISFAINGQLESVSSDNFLRVFENYMLFSSEEKNNG